MIDVHQEDEDWLSQFFSGRNQLRWEELTSNTAREPWLSAVRGWISILEEGSESTPICLPCLAEDGSVQWYAGARNLQGSHALADELQAFFGPSYSRFNGRPHKLDPSDTQEAVLMNLLVGPVFRIDGHTENEVSGINRGFGLFYALLKRRPPSLKPTTRPFGMVRGLFDRALLAGNEKEARALLDEMQRSGRLNAANLKFLDVRLLAGLGLWDQIVLESNLLKDLTDFPLPPRVVRDVSEAFFRFYVQEFDHKGGLDTCLETLRSSSLLRLDKLFSQRHGIRHPAVIKLFLLRELLRDPIDIGYSKSLLTELSETDKSALVLEVFDFLENRTSTLSTEPDELDLRKEADSAFQEVDYDRALMLYLRLPADSMSILRMIVCAQLAADEKSARKVLNFLSTVPGIKLDEATQARVAALKQQARPIPESKQRLHHEEALHSREDSEWLQWATWVANGAKHAEAIAILRQHSGTWPTEAICGNAEEIETFAGLLGNASGEAEEVFKAAFDEIFSAFLLDVDDPPASLKSLYRSLLFLLAASESLSNNELNLTTQLASNLLEMGLSEAQYEEVITLLIDLFESNGALSSLDWALDLIEVLVFERCQDGEARLRFFTMVSHFAQQSAHRITQSQRRALEALHRDFEIEFPDVLKEAVLEENHNGEELLSNRLAGKRIAIYTLTESAGQRAADRLKELAPNTEVILNSDHECTERLSALAKSADIFVFAWKSSKHQAFYCVKKHRPELPILQPLGKGSASIIREVTEYA